MKRSATKTWENIINSGEHWMEHQQARTKAEPAPRSTRADRLSTLIRCALRTRFVSCSCRSFASWVRTVRWESVSRWDHTFLFIKSFAIIISFLCFFENVGWLGFLVWSGAVVFFLLLLFFVVAARSGNALRYAWEYWKWVITNMPAPNYSPDSLGRADDD